MGTPRLSEVSNDRARPTLSYLPQMMRVETQGPGSRARAANPIASCRHSVRQALAWVSTQVPFRPQSMVGASRWFAVPHEHSLLSPRPALLRCRRRAGREKFDRSFQLVVTAEYSRFSSCRHPVRRDSASLGVRFEPRQEHPGGSPLNREKQRGSRPKEFFHDCPQIRRVECRRMSGPANIDWVVGGRR